MATVAKLASPLYKYFASLPDPHEVGALSVAESQGAFAANMYLAEDRILCFEICATKNKAYTLHWTKNSVAHTDIPNNLATLIKQRRRWLNGSFFAGLFSLIHFHKLFTQTTHSIPRKIGFFFQLIYMLINTVVTWFLMAAFMIALSVQVHSWNFDPIDVFGWFDLTSRRLNWGYLGLYLLIIIITFIVSLLKVNPTNSPRIYRFLTTSYTFLTGFGIAAGFFSLSSQQETQQVATIAASALPVALAFCSILHGELFTILSTLIQYLLMISTYINMFTVYAFCNIDDVSWGTKGIEKTVDHDQIGRRDSSEDRYVLQTRKENKRGFSIYRTKVVITYILTNLAILLLMAYTLDWLPLENTLYPDLIAIINENYVAVFVIVVSILLSYRVLGSVFYQVERLLKATVARSYVEKTRTASTRKLQTDKNQHGTELEVVVDSSDSGTQAEPEIQAESDSDTTSVDSETD